MKKKPFICISKPRIAYDLLEAGAKEPLLIPLPEKVVLFIEGLLKYKDTHIKVGDKVKTGQKLLLKEDINSYAISSVTGTICSISPYSGDFGRNFAAILIETAEKEEFDEQFKTRCNDKSIKTADDFLSYLPGNPLFSTFKNTEKPIDTIVIFGGNSDLLISTNQYVIQTNISDIISGIEVLKKITRVENVIIAVPRDLVSGFGHTGAKLVGVDLSYPSAHPSIIMQKELGKIVPAGKQATDMGVVFFSAEAAASVGKAFLNERIPVDKIVSLVKKDGTKILLKARLGTPLGHIFKTCGISLSEKDRIIIGGPLTGTSVYSEEYPVLPDTDAVIVQDITQVSLVSDYPCINCGECIRICPANVPVNMLVRFLAAGRYMDAADEYDLYSCIDCGLCSFVCVSKIPVFQYIRLAKYELSRIHSAEAANE
jgi:electron transport complex protein RnfC